MSLLVTVITVLCNFVLGALAYLRNPSHASNRLLFFLTWSIAFWGVFNYLSITSESEEITLFWIRTVVFVTTFMTLLIYLFLITFPSAVFPLSKRAFNILLIITFFIAVIGISPWTFQSVVFVNGQIVPQVSFGMLIFGSFIGLSIIAGCIDLFRRMKQYKGMQKTQVKIFLFGAALTFSLMGITNVIVAVFLGQSDVVILGPLFSLILVGFIFYSIIKHRFLGLRFVIGKILSYLILGLYTYGSFYVLILIHENIWGSVYHIYAYILGIPIAVIFVFIFKVLFEGLSSGRFLSFLYLYNPIEARDEFIKQVSSEIDLEKLLLKIVRQLRAIFKTKNIGVILFDAKTQKTLYEFCKGEDWQKLSPFLRDKRDVLNLARYWMDDHGPIIYVEEIEAHLDQKPKKYKKMFKTIGKMMGENNIEVIMPLNRRVEQNGFLFLGEKQGGDTYSVEDFALLESIIGFTGVAVQNSIAHREIQEFSEQLQSKVDEQTKEIQSKMEKMEKMRQREKDLLDVMGHELRTPLTIAKNAIEMIEMYKSNKKKKRKSVKWNQDMEKHFYYLKTAIRREMQIVETMLAATKLDAKRMDTNFEEVDLNEIVENTKLAFKGEAENKGLKFKIDMDNRKNWIVWADALKLQQVVDNLMSNAVKYTQQGYVKLSLKDYGNEVGIYVSDTGEGISQEEQKDLGKKFYRAKQYSSKNGKKSNSVVRPGGAGLGLYVVFGLVQLMEGKFKVDSKEGKGSTFKVYFKKPEEEKSRK